LQKAGAGGKLAQINNFVIPITNSCGEAFDPFPERSVPYLMATVSQNMLTYDPRLAEDMIQNVNVRSFQIDGFTVKEGQAMLMERTSSIEYLGQASYRKVSTTLLFKKTHNVILADVGMKRYFDRSNQFFSNVSGLIPIMNDNQETTKNELLDGKGNRLGLDPNGFPDQGQPEAVFLHYGVNVASDFRALNLPAVRL